MDVAEDGSKKPVALIGRIRELAYLDIIREVENFNRVADKWMVIPADAGDEQREDRVYDTLAEAKATFN